MSQTNYLCHCWTKKLLLISFILLLLFYIILLLLSLIWYSLMHEAIIKKFGKNTPFAKCTKKSSRDVDLAESLVYLFIIIFIITLIIFLLSFTFIIFYFFYYLWHFYKHVSFEYHGHIVLSLRKRAKKMLEIGLILPSAFIILIYLFIYICLYFIFTFIIFTF